MYGPTDEKAFDFPATLVDGSLVQIRPPAPVDRAALTALHGRVSQRNCYLRYFSTSRRTGEQYIDKVLAPHAEDLPGPPSSPNAAWPASEASWSYPPASPKPGRRARRRSGRW